MKKEILVTASPLNKIMVFAHRNNCTYLNGMTNLNGSQRRTSETHCHAQRPRRISSICNKALRKSIVQERPRDGNTRRMHRRRYVGLPTFIRGNAPLTTPDYSRRALDASNALSFESSTSKDRKTLGANCEEDD